MTQPATDEEIASWKKLFSTDEAWGGGLVIALIARIEAEQKRADELTHDFAAYRVANNDNASDAIFEDLYVRPMREWKQRAEVAERERDEWRAKAEGEDKGGKGIKWLYVIFGILLVVILGLTSDMSIARAECIGYVVQSGDTLFHIARANGTTWQELTQVNGLKKPDNITVGQCLTLNAEQATIAASSAKGLAMADWSHDEDLRLLYIQWFYGWGEYCNGQSGCINMVRNMEWPANCYQQLLVGNEPNAVEPYGAPVSPGEAAQKVIAIETQCPETKLVAGNVSADDWDRAGGWGSGENWLREFLRDYRSLMGRKYSGAISAHCYSVSTSDYCIQKLSQIRNLYKGEIWITEFNCLSCSTSEFGKLLNYISSHFARYAIYTARQPASAYEQGWGLQGADLINQDGSLTPNGVIYASK